MLIIYLPLVARDDTLRSKSKKRAPPDPAVGSQGRTSRRRCVPIVMLYCPIVIAPVVQVRVRGSAGAGWQDCCSNATSTRTCHFLGRVAGGRAAAPGPPPWRRYLQRAHRLHAVLALACGASTPHRSAARGPLGVGAGQRGGEGYTGRRACPPGLRQQPLARPAGLGGVPSLGTPPTQVGGAPGQQNGAMGWSSGPLLGWRLSPPGVPGRRADPACPARDGRGAVMPPD